jgi:molybdate transport system substrate-binding protein
MRARCKVVAWVFGAIIVAVALTACPAPRARAADEVLVFAAASLKTALDDVAAAWADGTRARATIAYAGSARLARQIAQGAPADLFISANIAWMDTLQNDRLIEPATRRNLLRNRIVLVAHGRSASQVTLTRGFDLTGLLNGGKLAMAMVDAVPAGIYGKAALTSLGVWKAIAPHVAQADNVRIALALVARGEAPYGIVYATDALASDNVTVVATFPPSTHPPIVYPAAVTTASRNRARARRFLDFLSSAGARSLFVRHGFEPIAAPGTN